MILARHRKGRVTVTRDDDCLVMTILAMAMHASALASVPC